MKRSLDATTGNEFLLFKCCEVCQERRVKLSVQESWGDGSRSAAPRMASSHLPATTGTGWFANDADAAH